MRLYSLLPVTALLFAAALNAQNLEQKLQWARATIDAHATTHHFDPPARSSGTRWQVTRIEGCTMEMKEITHRELPDSIINNEGSFGLSEDKVVTWTFDLGALLPQFIMAETAIDAPQIKIFAEGDAFHLKTDVVSRTLNKDGGVASTSTWSTPGSARNLWIAFDSPDADNKPLVRRLETDLRDAVNQCSTSSRASARPRNAGSR